MNSQNKALELTRRALKQLLIELETYRAGGDIVGTLTQLQSCRVQLEQMLIQLESPQLPPINQRLRGMGHMIADSWPLNAPLGEILLQAEQAYRKAK